MLANAGKCWEVRRNARGCYDFVRSLKNSGEIEGHFGHLAGYIGDLKRRFWMSSGSSWGLRRGTGQESSLECAQWRILVDIDEKKTSISLWGNVQVVNHRSCRRKFTSESLLEGARSGESSLTSTNNQMELLPNILGILADILTFLTCKVRFVR